MSFSMAALVVSRHGDFTSFPKRSDRPPHFLHRLCGSRARDWSRMGVGVLSRSLPCSKPPTRQSGDGCAAVSACSWSATASTGRPCDLGARVRVRGGAPRPRGRQEPGKDPRMKRLASSLLLGVLLAMVVVLAYWVRTSQPLSTRWSAVDRGLGQLDQTDGLAAR